MGLAPARKSFSQIAALAVEEMRRDLAAGTGKKVYEDYIQVIERYLVPFFGDRQLQTLKRNDIADFEAWRNEKMGKRPKSSTLMTFASAFSNVGASLQQVNGNAGSKEFGLNGFECVKQLKMRKKVCHI